MGTRPGFEAADALAAGMRMRWAYAATLQGTHVLRVFRVLPPDAPLEVTPDVRAAAVADAREWAYERRRALPDSPWVQPTLHNAVVQGITLRLADGRDGTSVDDFVAGSSFACGSPPDVALALGWAEVTGMKHFLTSTSTTARYANFIGPAAGGFATASALSVARGSWLWASPKDDGPEMRLLRLLPEGSAAVPFTPATLQSAVARAAAWLLERAAALPRGPWWPDDLEELPKQYEAVTLVLNSNYARPTAADFSDGGCHVRGIVKTVDIVLGSGGSLGNYIRGNGKLKNYGGDAASGFAAVPGGDPAFGDAWLWCGAAQSARTIRIVRRLSAGSAAAAAVAAGTPATPAERAAAVRSAAEWVVARLAVLRGGPWRKAPA